MEGSSQTFEAKKYLEHLYGWPLEKPDEETFLLEFILKKLHEYMCEGRPALPDCTLYWQLIYIVWQ
jgi:hypothetical protein